MRRLLSSAAILLLSGCLGDLLNIGEGPAKKHKGGTGGTSGASGTLGTAGPDDGGAGADTGGSPSRGGATSRGGTGGSGDEGGGGSGATSGSTGKGGSSGKGGSNGTGGSSGTGEPTSDPDVIARAAAVLGSCYGDDGVSRVATEFWDSAKEAAFFGKFRVQAECIAEAGHGCGALDTCLGWAIEEKRGCTPGWACDGSRSTYCVEESGRMLEWRLDCATLGLACDTRGICVAPPVVECDDATYVDNCAGDSPKHCRTNVEGPEHAIIFSGPDCASLGLECVAETRGTDNPIYAECTGNGDECEWAPEVFAVPMTCTGTTLEACVNARRQTLDCSWFGPGFSCQNYDGLPFCGLASECRPGGVWDENDFSQESNPEPACDGTTLVFCNAGRLEHIDCTDLGFTGCDVVDGLGCVPSPESDFR